MPKGDDLESRLIDFAVTIIRLCNTLPASTVGKHIARQLLRSGTSPAPNYAEARSAESQKDFVHKLKISLKELNETRVWLKMIVQSDLLGEAVVREASDECNQLCRILSTSIRTSTQNLRRNPSQ